MQWAKAIAPLAFISVSPDVARDQVFTDLIEASVALPANAHPLREYGRSYAYATPDTVVAVYLIPDSPMPATDGCEIMTESGSRPCTKIESRQSRDDFARLTASQVPAGTRRWFKDPKELSRIFDGGCRQVTIEYSISAKRFLSVRCNGAA